MNFVRNSWLIIFVLGLLTFSIGLTGCKDKSSDSADTAESDSTSTTDSSTDATTDTDVDVSSDTSEAAAALGGSVSTCENGSWEVVAPADQSFDAEKLAEVQPYAFQKEHHTQAVVVVRNGKLVAEWYASWANKTTCATSMSVAKSFSATLIGVALKRGDLSGIDNRASDYMTEWQSTGKSEITIRSMLEMRSGLLDIGNLYFLNNQLSASLNRSDGGTQGITHFYNNADSMLLTQIVARAAGGSLNEYIQTHLFDPMGFKGNWWTDNNEDILGYCCIDATTREFARLGNQKGTIKNHRKRIKRT